MSRVEVTQGPDAGLAWHYGNPVAEQRAIALGQAVADLSNRVVFTISGTERASWLHNLSTWPLANLGDRESASTLFLDGQGHIRFAAHLVDAAGTTWLWTDPAAGDGLIDFLESMRFRLDVEVQRRPDVRVVSIGDQVDVSPEALGVVRGDVGCEIFLPTQVALPSGVPVGTWALDAARIAAGVPRVGVDTDERTIPNEIGLYATALDKGCYPGQETVARIWNVGRPPRRLTRLLLDGSMDQLPEVGAPIELDGKQVGRMGSSARHWELGPVGLALVKRDVPVEATLVVGGIAASQEALVDPNVGLHVREHAPKFGRLKG